MLFPLGLANPWDQVTGNDVCECVCLCVSVCVCLCVCVCVCVSSPWGEQSVNVWAAPLKSLQAPLCRPENKHSKHHMRVVCLRLTKTLKHYHSPEECVVLTCLRSSV